MKWLFINPCFVIKVRTAGNPYQDPDRSKTAE